MDDVGRVHVRPRLDGIARALVRAVLRPGRLRYSHGHDHPAERDLRPGYARGTGKPPTRKRSAGRTHPPPSRRRRRKRRRSDGLVPYERERLERMRRNDEVMRRLGITESVNKLEGKAAPPPEKNPVIIIDDDEDDEAKNDTEDEDEEEEEDDDDETGGSTAATGAASQGRAATILQTARSRGATLTHTWDRCTSRVYLRGPVYLPMRPRRRGRSFTSTRSLPSSLRAPSDLVWFRQSTKAARLPGLTVQVRQKFLPSRRRKSSLLYLDCATSSDT